MDIGRLSIAAILTIIAGLACAQPPAPPSNLLVDGQGGSQPPPEPAPPPPPSSGAPTPGPGAQIVFDTRAGGAQDFQQMTSLSQMQSVYGGVRNSNGATSFFETNVDGRGTNARGCQWAAPRGGEQECFVSTDRVRVHAPATGWYTQFKTYLGKSPSGGGTGPVDSWILSGSNPHQKIFIWGRVSEGQRLYLRILPNGTNLVSDGLNYNSPMFSRNLYGMKGIIEVTMFIQPSTGTVRAWVNGSQVLDARNQNIGSSALDGLQETITTFPGQQQVQYMWDTVVWY